MKMASETATRRPGRSSESPLVGLPDDAGYFAVTLRNTCKDRDASADSLQSTSRVFVGFHACGEPAITYVARVESSLK